MSPDQLKSLRAKLGLSQAGLAQKLGVNRNTVARWEMGLHPIPAMAGKFLRLLDDRRTERVPVPEWGGEVLIRGLSGTDRKK